jgi:hypothetical protein
MNSRVDYQPKTTPASSDSSRSYSSSNPKKEKRKIQKFCRHHQIAESQATKRSFRNSSLQAELTRGNIFTNLLSVFSLLLLPFVVELFFFFF